MIRGSDGLDYEDLGARLVGEPAKTARNRVLGPSSSFDEAYKADYRETYDYYEGGGYDPETCHTSARAQADILRGDRISRIRAEAAQDAARFFRDRSDSLALGALRGKFAHVNPRDFVIDTTRAAGAGPVHDDLLDAIPFAFSAIAAASGSGGAGRPGLGQAAPAALCPAPEPPL